MSISSIDTVVAVGEALMEGEEGQEEFTPVLSFRQHIDEDLEHEEVESDCEPVQVVAKRRGRRSNPPVELPPPPNFQPLVHTEHKSFIRLPAPFDIGAPAPVSLFRLFFTDSMLSTIVTNTNLYAINKNAGSVGRAWKPVEMDELVTWIALTIYQGLYGVSSPEHCWNKDNRGPVHEISRYMKAIRFEQIKRYLHISPPDAPVNQYFDKVEPLLSHVREASKKYYTPGTNVSVDEMMIRFSGRSAHTVRIKNKPTPEGFKVFSLCESGYTYTFLPTSRISTPLVERVDGLTQTGNIVNHLVQQLPYSWLSYNVYMDNYFSSVKLFQYFRDIGVGACGTAKKQGGVPKELQVDRNIKLNWDTRSGVVKDGVLAVFWQDNGPVTMLTTIHGMIGEQWEVIRERRRPRETSTNAVKVRAVFGSSPRKELKILKAIDDYNFNMGGVDIADQLRSYHITQQTSRRNWMPLFFWLLDTVIVNTYLIARKAGSPLTHREFRSSLVWGLIDSVHHKNKRLRSEMDEDENRSSKRERVTKNFQLSNIRFIQGNHFAEWRERRSTCLWCSWRASRKLIFMDHKSPNQSQVWCVECDIPLCVNKTRSCFQQFHTE